MDKIDKTLFQAAVLLNRQYLLTARLIKTRSSVLQEFEHALTQKQENLNHVLDVYNYVLGLIDYIVRYQKIAMVLPRLSQTTPDYRALNNAMGDLKEIRNQIQHINNDIDNDNAGPLLGAVCWASGQRQYMASFHDIGRKRSSPGLTFDSQTGMHIQEFTYVYNEVHHDLGKAIEGMGTFDKFLNSVVPMEVDGKPYNPNDHFAALAFDFQVNSKGQ